MPPETPLHDTATVLDLRPRPAVLPGSPRLRRLARLQAADLRASAAVQARVLGRRRVRG